MNDSPERSTDSPPSREHEYQEPHYHDDEDFPTEEGLPRRPRSSGAAQPDHRIPPPRKRHYEG